MLYLYKRRNRKANRVGTIKKPIKMAKSAAKPKKAPAKAGKASAAPKPKGK